jgi:hypothetical protein
MVGGWGGANAGLATGAPDRTVHVDGMKDTGAERRQGAHSQQAFCDHGQVLPEGSSEPCQTPQPAGNPCPRPVVQPVRLRCDFGAPSNHKPRKAIDRIAIVLVPGFLTDPGQPLRSPPE